ncbi:LysE family translocator [Paenibacillus sp. 481]|uniref:LysE family translocator n=1 Tax=Paenibacillus sp. 481 TaxID=2835869 RepID=UPI001E2C1A89|nr:LysE family translocator [Paenibacillus sp. 481]UHA75043.1 LysE family translocator [Paenibacillus sp. 481]
MEQFTLFLMMSLALILTPGADTALVTKSTIRYGKGGGSATVFGTATGILVHTFAAATGLSLLLAQSALLYEIVKWIGAAYLIFIGVTSLLSKRPSSDKQQENEEEQTITALRPSTDYSQLRKCYMQGVITNVLNPKVALFFLTFLPQFVDANEASFYPYMIMGVTYAVLLIVWLLVFIWFIHVMKTWFQKPQVQLVIERITGVILIGFGLKVALEQRT